MRNVNDQSTEARRYRISRRTFLRGAGVVMALPWLESLPVWGVDSAAATRRFPQRFAAVFMGNGINPNHWWAKDRAPAWSSAKRSSQWRRFVQS